MVNVYYLIEIKMKKVVALFLIVLLFGCQQKEVVPKPDNLIDKEIIVNILYEYPVAHDRNERE